MTPAEAAKVLTIAGAYDNRRIDELTATAWAEALHDIEFADARDAVVAHYREERKWIMPADIIQRAKPKRSSWYDGLVNIDEWHPDESTLQIKHSGKFSDEEFDHLLTEYKSNYTPGLRQPHRNWSEPFDRLLVEAAEDRGVTAFASRRLDPRIDQWINN